VGGGGGGGGVLRGEVLGGRGWGVWGARGWWVVLGWGSVSWGGGVVGWGGGSFLGGGGGGWGGGGGVGGVGLVCVGGGGVFVGFLVFSVLSTRPSTAPTLVALGLYAEPWSFHTARVPVSCPFLIKVFLEEEEPYLIRGGLLRLSYVFFYREKLALHKRSSKFPPF